MASRRNSSLHGAAPDRSRAALVILDMLSDFRFPGGARIARNALPAARRIRRLRERAAAARVPAVYVNDIRGRWRSDFDALLRDAQSPRSRGAAIARLLAPGPRDYRVLKPKHSGFFATGLGTLLEYLGARTLILTGVTAEQCVLFTANDAYLRDFGLVIPRDCVAGANAAAKRLALRYYREVLGADVRAAARIRLPRRRR